MLDDVCLAVFLVFAFGAAALSFLAALAAFILLLTGQLFGLIYWAWAIFEEKVLGKKPEPLKKAKKQDYSISQSKPVE